MRIKLLAILILIGFQAFSQADKVVSLWLTQDGDSQVKIYKSADGKYFGQIKWLKNPTEEGKAKLDKHNPNDKLKVMMSSNGQFQHQPSSEDCVGIPARRL